MLFFNKTKKNQTREEERRRRNNEFIKRMGVSCLKTLTIRGGEKKAIITRDDFKNILNAENKENISARTV